MTNPVVTGDRVKWRDGLARGLSDGRAVATRRSAAAANALLAIARRTAAGGFIAAASSCLTGDRCGTNREEGTRWWSTGNRAAIARRSRCRVSNHRTALVRVVRDRDIGRAGYHTWIAATRTAG